MIIIFWAKSVSTGVKAHNLEDRCCYSLALEMHNMGLLAYSLC